MCDSLGPSEKLKQFSHGVTDGSRDSLYKGPQTSRGLSKGWLQNIDQTEGN